MIEIIYRCVISKFIILKIVLTIKIWIFLNYHSFDEKVISEAVESARKVHEGKQLRVNGAAQSAVLVAAQCLSVTVEDHKVCVNLPLSLRKHCIPISVNFPTGTVAKACLKICTTM